MSDREVPDYINNMSPKDQVDFLTRAYKRGALIEKIFVASGVEYDPEELNHQKSLNKTELAKVYLALRKADG